MKYQKLKILISIEIKFSNFTKELNEEIDQLNKISINNKKKEKINKLF